MERPGKPRRTWRAKFRDAFRGLKLGVRGHSSFCIHFFFAVLAVAACSVLGCSRIEWCLIAGCIGAVFTTELVNSALETLFRGLDEANKRSVRGCLDIAAAAVLVAALTSVVVGSIIFVAKLRALLDGVSG